MTGVQILSHMILYICCFAITWPLPALRFREIHSHANVMLYGQLVYSKNGGSTVVAASVILPQAYGFQPRYCNLQFLNDIVDDGQHIQTVLIAFLKNMNQS